VAAVVIFFARTTPRGDTPSVLTGTPADAKKNMNEPQALKGAAS